jgi:hypothetical protein
MGLADYTALTGSPPQMMSQNALLSAKQESGPFGKYNLIYTTAPDRADLQLLPNAAPTVAVPNVGALQTALQDLLTLADKWTNKLTQPATRLALGAVLAQSAPTIDAANLVVLAMIPDFKNAGGAIEDLGVQVNRPRDSNSATGVRINRLMRFATGVNIVFPAAFGVATSQPRNFIRAQFEIDLNTAVNTRPIAPPEVAGLLAEMNTLALDAELNGAVQ